MLCRSGGIRVLCGGGGGIRMPCGGGGGIRVPCEIEHVKPVRAQDVFCQSRATTQGSEWQKNKECGGWRRRPINFQHLVRPSWCWELQIAVCQDTRVKGWAFIGFGFLRLYGAL